MIGMAVSFDQGAKRCHTFGKDERVGWMNYQFEYMLEFRVQEMLICSMISTVTEAKEEVVR